jgi:hypothetical protein
MSFATTDLTALETALATGKLEVRMGDMIVKYQTAGDIMNAIEYVKGELIATGALAAPVFARTSFMAFSRD